MLVVDRIDQSLALFLGTLRINISGNLSEYCSVEVLIDHLTVEVVYVKIKLVIEELPVDNLPRCRIIYCNRVATLIMDPILAKLCGQFMRSVMIHQISLNDRFSVAVFIYRLSKNTRGLKRRCRSKCNAHCIKIFDHIPVFTLVIKLIPVQEFILPHFFIQNVSSVCLINDDQIIVSYSRHILPVIIENTLDHALYCCHLNTGLFINALILKPLDIVDIVQRHQILDLNVFEYVRGLLSQCIAIHQEQDPAESSRLQEAIDHAQNRTGFACSRSHRNQDILLTIHDCLLGGANRPQLVFSQIETVFICQQVIRHFLKLLVACIDILLQKFQHSIWADPPMECFRSIVRKAQIQKPNS